MRRDRPLPLHRLALGLLSCCLAWAGGSAAQTPPTLPGYSLDPGHTFVHWEVLHLGTSTTRGRFDRVGGVVLFDAPRQQVDVSITADTASVSTGLPAFDQVMRGGQLLAVEQHPQAYFTARRGRWDGPLLRELQGEITLRGISQPLTLKALRFKCGFNPMFGREVCGGDFEATLRRSDFGMTLALPLVADQVRLLVQVEGLRAE
jgi:polyisoprenoid-binding protein YceI